MSGMKFTGEDIIRIYFFYLPPGEREIVLNFFASPKAPKRKRQSNSTREHQVIVLPQLPPMPTPDLPLEEDFLFLRLLFGETVVNIVKIIDRKMTLSNLAEIASTAIKGAPTRR